MTVSYAVCDLPYDRRTGPANRKRKAYSSAPHNADAQEKRGDEQQNGDDDEIERSDEHG